MNTTFQGDVVLAYYDEVFFFLVVRQVKIRAQINQIENRRIANRLL